MDSIENFILRMAKAIGGFLLIMFMLGLISGKEKKALTNEQFKFDTMAGCLDKLGAMTSYKLKPTTDQLGEVSGDIDFPNGGHFSCKTKASGTQGVFVEGTLIIY